MTASVIGTTACLWCSSPLLLYKNNPYTRYCKKPAVCRYRNRDTIALYRGSYRTAEHREKKALERARRKEK